MEAYETNGGYVKYKEKTYITKTVYKEVMISTIAEAGYRPNFITMLGSRQTIPGKARPKLEGRTAAEIMEDLGVIMETLKEAQEAGSKLQRIKTGRTKPTTKPIPIGTQGQIQWTKKTHPGYKNPCTSCEKSGGTRAQQKKMCSKAGHCWTHGGALNCTQDKDCRMRTAKKNAQL